MSKPLELTIFPPIPECPPRSDFGYAYEDWADNRSIERELGAKKRLTDAELAAEYWSAHALWERAIRGQSFIELIFEREAEIWTRFATLPHYDEVDS
ncbi:hypothetical protein [Arthrobacter sp. efr-133-R2A-63]|uniref:hypothetical protein n=1 Tax=Arthrobacter sp. efr-133-R2A-63 TaxID=3040278 RepID=UPI00254A3BA7|nr:hypothetical protein [Arthrobacter sp. efr-133-R2A-63]